MNESTTRGSGCRHFSFSGLLALAMMLPAICLADDTLLDRATEAFHQGNYLEAAELMEDAYGRAPVPLYLFNIGRAYQEAGRWLEAREYFESFLLTDPPAAERGTAERHLAAVVALLPPPPEPLPPPPPPRPGPPLTPWLVAGAGLLIASSGGVLLYLAHDRRDSVRGAERDSSGAVSSMSQAEAYNLRREADTLATAGGALAGVGAAAITAGAMWGMITRDRGEVENGLQLVPENSGLSIGWRATF